MKATPSNNSRQPATRRVGIVAFPGSQILDITGPLAVFAEADQICQKRFNTGQAAYQIELISTGSDRLIECYCGVNLTARTDFRSLSGKFDTLLIAGGYGVLQADKVAGFLPWLRNMSRKTRRIGSVCSGSYALAAAGLLDGKRATTHWYCCQQFAEWFPAVEFDSNPIFIRDGKVYTSAGVTTGIDMSLGLVAMECGEEQAKLVQLTIEYDPQPPFDAGSIEKASPAMVNKAKAYLAEYSRKASGAK